MSYVYIFLKILRQVEMAKNAMVIILREMSLEELLQVVGKNDENYSETESLLYK